MHRGQRSLSAQLAKENWRQSATLSQVESDLENNPRRNPQPSIMYTFNIHDFKDTNCSVNTGVFFAQLSMGPCSGYQVYEIMVNIYLTAVFNLRCLCAVSVLSSLLWTVSPHISLLLSSASLLVQCCLQRFAQIWNNINLVLWCQKL